MQLSSELASLASSGCEYLAVGHWQVVQLEIAVRRCHSGPQAYTENNTVPLAVTNLKYAQVCTQVDVAEPQAVHALAR